MRRPLLVPLLLFFLAGSAGAQEAVTPWIGIGLERGTEGVRIGRLIDGAPGSRDGLRVGDEVLSIDGAPLHRSEDLIDLVAQKGVGETVTLKILRGKKRFDTRLALDARPDMLSILRDGLVGKKAPAFALEAMGPHPARLDALAGNVVVIEFWATWCGPCNSTMPRLNAWQQKYGPRGLRVIGISTETPDVVRHHVEGRGVKYSLAFDDGGKVSGAFNVPAVPTFVVIDGTGVVRYVDVGAGSRVDGVEAAFLSLLRS